MIETKLAEKYKYKKLPTELSKQYRNLYEYCIPGFLNANGDTLQLLTSKGTPVTSGYERIVIGDYGAFVEFNETQSHSQNYFVPKKQKFRLHTNIPKYEWWSVDDESKVKIYKQKRGVSYADYLVGMFYVSVHEVFPI